MSLLAKFSIYLTLISIFLSGCSMPAATNLPSTSPATPVVSLPPATPAADTATPTLPPTATGTPASTATATIIPSPTPTLHPMSIAAQRLEAYPGSPITFEQILEPGANYYRYYVSYLSDGLKIYALLTVPYGERPVGGWPAIVFNHGYIQPEVYRTTERYIAYVDRLAANGYVVFRIDYRGHDRSEGEPTGAYGSPGYTSDVLNAVASIRQYADVNPERVGMWGHSMGGYLTLRAMVISPDIKAGVIWGGVVGTYKDMMYNWRDRNYQTPTPDPTTTASPRRWRTNFLDEFGTPEENPEFWASISANSYLAELSGPVQLHHAVDDESVPVAFSEKLAEQILQAGGIVDLYTYENDDHNISQSFTLAMSRTIAFFDAYLKMP